MAAEPQPPLAAAGGAATSSAAARWLTSPTAALCILALFYAALLASLRDTSATFDEPGHATAGYVYWKYGDYRLDPENGNLSKRWIALPYLFRSDKFIEPDNPAWLYGSWVISDAWFNRLGNDTAAMLRAGRAFAGLTAVALGLVVWFWARQLFGPLGSMISLLLYVLSPVFLANGALMTSDLPTALGFIASLGCIWALLQRITLVRIIGGTLAIAGLFLAKMSAPLLLPMAGLLAVARLIDGRPLPAGRRMLAKRWQQAAAIASVAVIQMAAVVCLVWAAYGFRYSAFSPTVPGPQEFKEPWEWYLRYPAPLKVLDALKLTPEQRALTEPHSSLWGGANADWSHAALADFARFRARVLTPTQIAAYDALMRPDPSLVPRLLDFARSHRLLPESFIAGYAHVWRTSDRNSAFFNGKVGEQGWAWFFPYVFVVKTPLPFLALLGLAAAIAVVVWREQRASSARERGESAMASLWRCVYPFLPFLALIVVYWATMLHSKLNIGHRHLLPTYPPLIVAAGALSLLWARRVSALLPPAPLRRLRWLAGGLGLALLVDIAARFPLYIAYFNGLILPDRAYRHVVDSSLDWGQELPAIARFLEKHPNEKAYLAYFGVGEPENYGIDAQFIGGTQAMSRRLYPPVLALMDTTMDAVRDFLKKHPKYTDRLVLNLDRGDGKLHAGLIQRSEDHRLGPGLYVISATMLQGVYHGKAGGPWRPQLQPHYLYFEKFLEPFLTGDHAAILKVGPKASLDQWNATFEDYYNLRLSRLTAYLRQREPTAIIHHAVLVYRLTAEEVNEALTGPIRP